MVKQSVWYQQTSLVPIDLGAQGGHMLDRTHDTVVTKMFTI